MARRCRFVALGSSVLLAGGLVAGGATAASPGNPVHTSIRLVGTDGFEPVSETVVGKDTVVDTFRSSGSTIRLIGRAGSTAAVSLTRGSKHKPGGMQVTLNARRPKTERDVHAYRDAGRTVVGDLVSLGMARDEAEREFGALETLDGHNPYLDVWAANHTSTRSATGVRSASAPDVTAGTTPYDVLCADVNAFGGRVVGRGCSTLYLVARNGADWWFDNKYRFSAHSTDTSVPIPLRLVFIGWDLHWASGNVVYDWDPDRAVEVGKCTTVTTSISDKGGISISGTICPNKLDVWTVTSTRSGAKWTGTEHNNDWEAVVGVQAVHSPPGAPASYGSTFGIVCTSC
jgi:hypothetical protein